MSTVSVNIPVPSSGFGSAVDVSSLVGEKTVALSGRYRGAYVLYGSHDGSRFAPLLIFNAGGIEGIKQTFKGAFAWLKLKSLATGAVGVSASVSGLSVAGDNSFTSLGVGTVLDLGNDAYQVDLNFMGFGQVNGAVVVEGSLDGIGFNPIGEFASSGAGASLLGGGSGIEFSPVATNDRVRYVRLNVQGAVGSGFMVTVGGAQSETGGSGGAETLAAAYAAGLTSVDQTMIVSHANGGKVVFDGTGLSVSDHETVEILGQLGYGALTLGPRNIGIGVAGFPPVDFNDPTSSLCVAMGFSHVDTGNQCVAIGVTSVTGDFTVAIGGGGCNALGEASIAIGHGAGAQVDECIAIGDDAVADGNATICIGFSSFGGDFSSFDNISLGRAAVATNPGDAWGSSNVVIGSPAYAAITNGSVSIGSGANAQGFDHLTHLDVGLIAIGYGADVISHGASIGIGNGIIVHNSSLGSTNESCVGIGDGASSVGAGGTVVVGALASSQSNRTVTCGLGAATLGDGSIALGYGSKAGDIDEAPSAVAVGSGSSAYEDSDIVIGNLAHTDDTNPLYCHNIAIGNGASVLGGASGVALGDGAGVTGAGGMAFGTSATAGSNQVMFGSTVAGISRYEVVSNDVAHDDLFNFDVASLTGADTTSLTLLIMKSDGITRAAVPVTIGVNDSGGTGYALLRVANT